MRRLEGGCSVPLGVSTRMMLAEDYYTNHGSGGERNVKNNDSIEYILELVGCVCSVDGIEEIKEMTTGLIHFPKSKAPPPYTSAKSSSQQTSPTPPPPPPPSELYIDITGTDKELYHSLISSAQDVGTRLGNTLIEKGARRILDAIRPNSFK